MKDLIIIGASGFGREVAWLVERINAQEPTWKLLGFIDDNQSIQGKHINGYAVLGTTSAIADYPDAYLVCAVGAAKVRKSIIERIKENYNVKFATLIDPSVERSDCLNIGAGSIICAHSILTVNIEIGNHVIINLDCTVGHDAKLKDYVTVYPSVNVSGNVLIGECVELGTGTQIIQGKEIGSETIVGAGAVVVKDLPAKCTAVGSPARPIKFFDGEEKE
ncbi:MAG TPA: acetyltransferase [Erysipelotrichaceae bacterium]|nr:acetyltransferase [Erysipelotrichaceae bacterium]HQB31832.1 acetyltransferase [Erysipelotrichaceae bacterium]